MELSEMSTLKIIRINNNKIFSNSGRVDKMVKICPNPKNQNIL